MAFVDHEENLRVQEQFVAFIVGEVPDRCREELVTLGRDVSKLERVKPPFPRITYDDAIGLLREAGMEAP